MKESKPLEGVSVVDFTRLLPGPLGTHLLSQLGAQVIKIESPKRMDYTRVFQPKIEDTSTLYHSLNHSKEQIIVDYETDEGYDRVCEIIKDADILVEQFRPGAMASFNLDFKKVKEINPNIVYISVTGYGQTGALSKKAGHDLNYIASSGLLDLNRDDHGKPVIPGFQIADIAGGSYMLLSACTTGLLAQKIQDKPQYLDVSLLEGSLPLAAIPFSMLQGGADYKQMPVLSGMFVNYNVYECKDGEWIALAALEPKFWIDFCKMADKPEWEDLKDFDLMVDMFPKNELDDLFKSKNVAEWVALSKDYDACLSKVVSLEDLSNQTYLNERNVFNKIDIANDKIHTYSSPFKTYI